jgi:hypothetical protein
MVIRGKEWSCKWNFREAGGEGGGQAGIETGGEEREEAVIEKDVSVVVVCASGSSGCDTVSRSLWCLSVSAIVFGLF